nr:chloroplast envelope membrane protein [Streptosarcina sp. YL-2023a]
MKPQIIILKSFLTESIYSLSDTTKSFLLILSTDLLVGFHSPRGWEFLIEFLLKHFGLPESRDFIYLFVATFPVLLDTVFKYWIFRYLNKISPSTVATYHSMIE